MSGYIDFVNLGGTRKDLRDIRGDNLALIDGYYEEMTVGDAEQLVATVGVNDKVPYLFRTSGGSADIGDREVDKIVGGSFPWNQWIDPEQVTELAVDETRAKVVALTSGARVVAGHKYLYVIYLLDVANVSHLGQFSLYTKVSGSAARIANIYAKEAGVTAAIFTSEYSGISSGGTSDEGGLWQYFSLSAEDTGGTTKVKAQLFDLTQMFGSTIADYIASLETSTPGAGVAWFRKLFPKPYYAYNAGSMESVETDLHKMTGFNQWDEQWELGTYNESTGAAISGDENIRSKNFIPVVPGATYYFKAPNNIVKLAYDSAKNYIGVIGTDSANATREIPENCAFIKFYMYKAYGTTYKNDICINIHWDGERDGEYEPYVAHEYALSPVVLRGVPKLDSGNKLYYDGDTYEADGTVTRRFGIVDLGTLDWSWQSSWGAWYTTLPLAKRPVASAYFNAVSEKYRSGTQDAVLWHEEYVNYMAKAASSDNFIVRNGSEETTPSGYLVYELATPTTEQANPYQTPQIVDDWGTEEYRDALATAQSNPRDVAIPVGHDTTYRNNLRAKLEMAPESPSGDGDYILRQTSGQNEYVLLEKELPSLPSEDGTYTLKCTVSGTTKTLTWESDAE